MNKSVTIAIPVYNAEKYILSALKSIVNQTRKVDSILICDNHSTDQTINITKKFIVENRHFNFTHIINEINLGPHANFNKCMEVCTTDYLLMLAADDVLKNDAIEKLLSVFEKHPKLALVGGYVDLIDSDGIVIQKGEQKETIIYKQGEVLEFVRNTNLYIQTSTVMINSKLTRKLGFWDEMIGCDERHYAKILSHFPIARIGDAIVLQRIHSNQGVRNENSDFKGRVTHFKENLKVADLEQDKLRRRQTRKLIKKWVSDYCIAICSLEISDGNHVILGLRYWLYGFFHNPSYFLFKYFRKGKHFAKRIFNIK